ncbi:MAG: YfhO family protein, partial [Gelidibacter sp.]|nr:YfhO family protein [Gelidibacter sp.]
MLLVLVLGLVYLIDAYRKKVLPHYFKSVGILLVAVILSIGLNATNIMATQEYVKHSTRGKSEITINPDGTPKVATSGLDKDYITEYSYGILESLNLFIPRFMGGGGYEDVGKDSASYNYFIGLGALPVQALQQTKQIPTYWGNQPIVEAPAYVGAVVLFLFVFALFLVKGRLKWWLVGGTLLSLLLSYGKNLGFLTDFFIDYVPMYNKFRAVSSIQVILELCVPVLAIFGLVRLFNDFESKDDKLKALKLSALITGGLAILFLVFKSSFSFVGISDGYYIQNYGQAFINAVKTDRKTFFTEETLRSLLLVLLSAGTIFMFLKQKVSEKSVVVIFAALILFDLVGVDKRYVNNDDFVSALQVNTPFQPTKADIQIAKDTTHFRVYDVTSGGARASYFHNSLGGYSAAKLERFEELNSFHLAKNNINVLNMLNTKYIIADDDKGAIFPYLNADANGNAWFINDLVKVASANEELTSLDSLDTKIKAITTQKLSNQKFITDSTATISIKVYKPNYLKYKSNNKNDGFAVFSEIYYAEGWNAYIDGKLTPHYRVDYVLRGLPIPKGTHTIEFKFEPQVIQTGSSIALASSILLALLIVGGLYLQFKTKPEESA